MNHEPLCRVGIFQDHGRRTEGELNTHSNVHTDGPAHTISDSMLLKLRSLLRLYYLT